MRWKVILDFLRDIFSALSHAAGDSADKEEPAPAPGVPTVDTVTGWAGEPPYRYVDVSRYQGLIDWAQVAAAGYKGAMLKTVSTNYKLSKRSDGLYIDPTFETNYRNARAAGLDVGVYYYTYATSEAMADAELALLRQAVYGKEFSLPVCVDVEENKLKQLSTLDLTNLTAYALEQAAALIAPNGLLSVMCYPGHEGGKEEAEAVEAFLSRLPHHSWRAGKYQLLNTGTPAPFQICAFRLD